MADWNAPVDNPIIEDAMPELRDRDIDAASWGTAQTVTNPFTGMKRWNAATNYWEEWSGSAWVQFVTQFDLARLRLSEATAASLASTAHGFQLGPTSGANLALSPAQVQARNNGAAAALDLNLNGGAVRVGGVNVLVDSGTLNPERLPQATESAIGASELATQAEVNTGTDAQRIVTPATLDARLVAMAIAVTKMKTASESVTASTTYQTDDHLTNIVLKPATQYLIEADLIVFCGPDSPAGGLRVRLLASNAAQSIDGSWFFVSSSGVADASGVNLVTGASVVSLTTNATYHVRIVARLLSHATLQSTLALQWAQASSSGEATTMYPGSYLRAKEIG